VVARDVAVSPPVPLETEDVGPLSRPASFVHRRRWREFALAIAGACILALMLVAAFVSPLPHSATVPDVTALGQGPSGTHWFGTDDQGFDIFARTIRSARTDLPLALIGTLLSLLIGVVIGLFAGARSRWSGVIMRGVDLLQSFPLLILAIAIVALTGNHINNVVLAILLVNVPRFIRLVRAEMLALRESRFIEAAVVVGCSRRRVLFRHALPNLAGIVLAQASLSAAVAITVIAALNFLGIGVSPPTPTWGVMMHTGAETIAQGEWWATVFPVAAFFLAVMSFNLIADSIERHLRYGHH
jgi:peptide/nickel transport system permease protein